MFTSISPGEWPGGLEKRFRGMKKYTLILVHLLLIGGMVFSTGAGNTGAQEASWKNAGEEIKILITADQVEFDPQNNMATYRGGVKVTQDNTFLYADRIEVYWVKGKEEIDQIKAYDNISIVKEDKVITAQKGIYYHRDRKVILTGNPMTRQGKNSITGDTITYFWDEGKVLIEGNAKAIIAVEEEKSTLEQENSD